MASFPAAFYIDDEAEQSGTGAVEISNPSSFVLPNEDYFGWSKDGKTIVKWKVIKPTAAYLNIGEYALPRYHHVGVWEDNTEYSVTKKDAIGIAAAIRAKGRTSATMEFPTGFISAIEAL